MTIQVTKKSESAISLYPYELHVINDSLVHLFDALIHMPFFVKVDSSFQKYIDTVIDVNNKISELL